MFKKFISWLNDKLKTPFDRLEEDLGLKSGTGGLEPICLECGSQLYFTDINKVTEFYGIRVIINFNCSKCHIDHRIITLKEV